MQHLNYHRKSKKEISKIIRNGIALLGGIIFIGNTLASEGENQPNVSLDEGSIVSINVGVKGKGLGVCPTKKNLIQLSEEGRATREGAQIIKGISEKLQTSITFKKPDIIVISIAGTPESEFMKEKLPEASWGFIERLAKDIQTKLDDESISLDDRKAILSRLKGELEGIQRRGYYYPAAQKEFTQSVLESAGYYAGVYISGEIYDYEKDAVAFLAETKTGISLEMPRQVTLSFSSPEFQKDVPFTGHDIARGVPSGIGGVVGTETMGKIGCYLSPRAGNIYREAYGHAASIHPAPRSMPGQIIDFSADFVAPTLCQGLGTLVKTTADCYLPQGFGEAMGTSITVASYGLYKNLTEHRGGMTATVWAFGIQGFRVAKEKTSYIMDVLTEVSEKMGPF